MGRPSSLSVSGRLAGLMIRHRVTFVATIDHDALAEQGDAASPDVSAWSGGDLLSLIESGAVSVEEDEAVTVDLHVEPIVEPRVEAEDLEVAEPDADGEQ